jgi:hypothetical protein
VLQRAEKSRSDEDGVGRIVKEGEVARLPKTQTRVPIVMEVAPKEE